MTKASPTSRIKEQARRVQDPDKARKEEANTTQSGVSHSTPKAPPAQQPPRKEACLSAPGTQAVYQA